MFKNYLLARAKAGLGMAVSQGRLPAWTEHMVEQYVAPFGLDQLLLRQIDTARGEGISDRAIEWGVEKIVYAAIGNSKRYGKPLERYVRRAIENGHLLNYTRGVRRAGLPYSGIRES